MRSHELLYVSGLLFLSLAAAHCGSNTRPPNDFKQQAGSGGKASGGAGTTKNGGGDSNVSTGPGDLGPVLNPDPPTAACGNGREDPGEDCDDGNPDGGDGCTKGCRIEDGWDCPKAGRCTRTTKCGDGKLTTDETCDDGNTNDGDGCSADCKKIEEHWVCRVPGQKCVPECGDNFIVEGMEKCDDGNTTSGDGCSSTCVLEPGYTCTPPPDSKCTTSECGNGIKEAGENCDNGKDKNGLFYGDGTGCSKTCTSEPKCRDDKGTRACDTSCGDRNIDPSEECDDGNTDDNDGCSHDCKAEQGFKCDPKEDTDLEDCPDGGGKCLILPITFRDFDGQNASKGHPDFFFMGAGSPKTYCVPNASGRTADDNGDCPGTDAEPLCSGLVNAVLGTDGKPALGSKTECKCTFTDWDGTGVLSGVSGKTTCSDQGGNSHDVVKSVNVKVIKDANSFKQWYSDSDLSTKVVKTLALQEQGSNLFQFSSSDGRTVYDDLHDIFSGDGTSLNSGFFELEDQTGVGSTKICNLWPYWVSGLTTSNCKTGSSNPVTQQWDPRGWDGDECRPDNAKPTGAPSGCPLKSVTGKARNFYMTSEVRYFFRFVGGETLEFYGDDDVWVFINGHLALDLGAPHERLRGKVTLPKAGGTTGTWSITTQDIVTAKEVAIDDGTTPALGLEADKTYEIAIFHADRHPRESNYQLTVQGFASKHSVCASRCGDGIATPTEECDDGDNNKDPSSDEAYGKCTTECKFGPWCGDGVKNGTEECDKGKDNGGAYGDAEGCTLGCLKTHRCGDGIVDGDHGEACDNGDQNGTGDSWCQTNCQVKTVQN